MSEAAAGLIPLPTPRGLEEILYELLDELSRSTALWQVAAAAAVAATELQKFLA